MNLLYKAYKNEMTTERTWIHIDMDMFFAACEIRENPDLNKRPLAVGDYSMIMTTNYEARKWGVRPAMPGFIGKNLCPQLSFVKSDKAKYKKISEEEFLPILREYDPNLETIGLDEANLDITEYLIKHDLNHQEGRMELGSKIRKRIFEKMKMTASMGIACNKMLSKICSEVKKPDG